MKRIKKIILAIFIFTIVAVLGAIISIKRMDFNQYKGMITEQVKKATGRELIIAGDLAVDISLTPAIAVEDVRLSNASWATKSDMVSVKRFAVQVELLPLLQGKVQIMRLLLEGAEIFLETNEKGLKNWAFDSVKEPQPASTDKAPLLPVVQEMLITGSRLTYLNGKTGEEKTFHLERLSTHASSLQAPLGIEFTVRHDALALQLNGSLGSISSLLHNKPYALSLTGEIGTGNFLKVAGAIKSPKEMNGIDLALGIQGNNIANLGTLAKITLPANPYSFHGQLQDKEGSYALRDFSITIGESDLTGRCSINFTKKRPALTANLQSQNFDTAALLIPTAKKSKQEETASRTAPTESSTKNLFSTTPLQLDSMKLADAAVTLNMKQLQHNKLSLQEISLAFSLQNGSMKLSPLQAKVANGTLHTEIKVDAGQSMPKVMITGETKGVILGTLINKLTNSSLLEDGPMDLFINASGRGKSIHDIMASLSGQLLVQVGNGRLNNKAIDLAGADLLSELMSGLNPFSKSEDASQLTCAVLNLSIDQGVSKRKNSIGIETAKMYVSGGGTINLDKEILDLSIKPKARGGIGISAGVLADMVRLQGPLSNPKPSVDAIGVAKTAASIGAAISTGGLSLLGQALLGKVTDNSPCEAALKP